jgi:hypothetical protein
MLRIAHVHAREMFVDLSHGNGKLAKSRIIDFGTAGVVEIADTDRTVVAAAAGRGG